MTTELNKSYPNHMISMKELAKRLNMSTSKLYQLINIEDDSKSIIKGTTQLDSKRLISSWRVDEICNEIQKSGGIDSYVKNI